MVITVDAMRVDYVQTVAALIISSRDHYGSNLAFLMEILESLDVRVGFVVGLQWMVRHGLTIDVKAHIVTVEKLKVKWIFGVISVSGSRRDETQRLLIGHFALKQVICGKGILSLRHRTRFDDGAGVGIQCWCIFQGIGMSQ
jgi:hypothetical protein